MNTIDLFSLKKRYYKYKKNYLKIFDKILSSGKYILGENVYKLEQELKNYCKSPYCITTSNGTDALESIIRSLDIGSGDEIVVPVFSWISTASSVSITGAKPVFCDIDKDSYNLCPIDLKKKISSRTKAVIIVSLFGQISPHIFEIAKFCKKRNFFLIEDAAQSFGASLNQKKSCNIADFSITSFFPTKSLGCFGDGGAIFSLKKKIFQ